MINTLTSDEINIPTQLQRDDIRFIMLMPRSKVPIVSAWNEPKNALKGYDPNLSKHLKASGNYGIYPDVDSNLLFLDIDLAYEFHAAGGLQLVADTYQYSAWPDRSKYRAIITCRDIPIELRGHKSNVHPHGSDKAVVEIFYPAGPRNGVLKAGGQVVGPNSIHPNGNPYAAIDENAPIIEVAWSDLQGVINTIRPEYREQKISKEVYIQGEYASHGRKLLRDRYPLDPVMPENPQPTCNGEYRGKNPFHTTTRTDGNMLFNPFRGIMHCFLCGRGYDAAGMDAINRGIITCGDDYDAAAFKEHVIQLEADYPEVRVKERALWIAKQRAIEAKKPKLYHSGTLISKPAGKKWR